jgi:hypothetical protein
LCKEFPALSPYDIEKRTYHDVIRLYADVRAMQIRDAKDNDQQSNTTKVIRRRAGDDWF